MALNYQSVLLPAGLLPVSFAGLHRPDQGYTSSQSVLLLSLDTWRKAKGSPTTCVGQHLRWEIFEIVTVFGKVNLCSRPWGGVGCYPHNRPCCCCLVLDTKWRGVREDSPMFLLVRRSHVLSYAITSGRGVAGLFSQCSIFYTSNASLHCRIAPSRL